MEPSANNQTAGRLSADSTLIRSVPAPPNWSLAVVAGCIAMLVGAIVWAAITVASEHQIGWMALGVGALVGWAVSFGKGGKAFGLLGALLALIGCILGNFLSIVAFAVAREKIGVLTSLAGLDYAKVATLMWDSFLSTDFLFYAIAVYEGYRFSSVGRGK